MEVTVNSEKRTFSEEEMQLDDLLKSLGVDPEQSGIAIAVNYSVVPRSEWENTKIMPSDEIEVITARQGG